MNDLAALEAVTLALLFPVGMLLIAGLGFLLRRKPATPAPARWVVVVPFRYQPCRLVYEDVETIRAYPELEEFSD